MPFPAPPGVFDILPKDLKEEWKNSHLWNYVESVIRSHASLYGFQEIRTPILEKTELFKRVVGETSDIVTKEMYTFTDRGGRSLSLRPEGTAPVMRAIMEHNLAQNIPSQRYFYICPMFRYERSQSGRYRQHHQFGVEVVGISSPHLDAEIISLLYDLYRKLSLKNLSVYINSIGSPEARQAYKNALKEYLRPRFDQLSKDSQNRFESNPLRILDSKDPGDQEILKNSPSILDFLSGEDKADFEQVKTALDLLNIPYKVNSRLVRGLDYYNKTVFEIVSGELGSQNSIGGGGRYDDLLKSMGGPDLPAVGFGTGIERIIQAMLKQKVPIPEAPSPLIFLIPLGSESFKVCFTLLDKLRQTGISSQMELTGKKVGKAMQFANQIQAKYVIIIGDEELKTEKISLKEMRTGKEEKIPLNYLPEILKFEIKNQELMQSIQEISTPFSAKEESEYFLGKISDSINETKKYAAELKTAVEKIKELFNS